MSATCRLNSNKDLAFITARRRKALRVHVGIIRHAPLTLRVTPRTCNAVCLSFRFAISFVSFSVSLFPRNRTTNQLGSVVFSTNLHPVGASFHAGEGAQCLQTRLLGSGRIAASESRGQATFLLMRGVYLLSSLTPAKRLIHSEFRAEC